MQFFRRINGLVLIASLALLTACGSGGSGSGGSNGEAKYPTTSLQVTVGGGSMLPASLKFSPNAFLGTFADVASVTVVVSGQDEFGVFQNPLASVSLTQGPGGVWQGTIPNLPVGPVLTFTARGYNAGSLEIFNGVLTQALTGTADALAIAMTPVDDGVPIAFPIITAISLPAEITVGSSVPVNVSVIGSPSSTLNYAFTSGGGSFTPNSGSIGLLSGGTGTVGTTYTAPAAIDTYNQTVRVTNSQGNAVEADFPTVVVHELTTPGVATLFAPTLTALLGKRTGNNVTWTATVQDDKDAGLLTFTWNFTQTGGTPGAAFSTAGANPGVMSSYDQTVTGTVSLTITDGDNLSTTVSFTLVPLQFPDAPVGPPLNVVLQTDSGTLMAAEGTWTGCQAGNNLREEHTFTGSVLAISTYTGTAGSTCAGGTFAPSQSGSFHITALSTVAIQGWIDGMGDPASAPARASGTGSLSATPMATLLTVAGNFGGSSMNGTVTVFVDDSTATPKLWRSSSSGSCPAVGGVEVCLVTVDPLYFDGDIPFGPEVIAAAASQSFTLAIQGNGTLWAWGATASAGSPAFAPVQVGTATDWTAVSAGAVSAHGVRSDGTLWGWGSNTHGQLGNGTTATSSTPVQAGTDTNWAAVSAGAEFSLALRTDGTLWATGRNVNGQLGDGTTTGRLTYGQVGSDSNWAAISAGYNHALAIRTDGTLWAWGKNAEGQIGDGTTGVDRLLPVQVGSAADWIAVSAAHHHNVGIRSDGTLWAWGTNVFGELGDGTTAAQAVPTQIGSGANWAAVAVGYDHSHAIRGDGTLWSWGGNSNGYLGDGTSTGRLSPVQVGAASASWTGVAAGTSQLLAIKSGGALWGAGFNTFGALGDGTSTNRPTPVLPAWP